MARVVWRHFLSTCCSHAAETICPCSSLTLEKLTVGTMSAPATTVVTNGAHDSESSLESALGQANAKHFASAKALRALSPPSSSRSACVRTTATPAPRLWPTMVSSNPGFWSSAIARSSLIVFASQRAVLKNPACARPRTTAPVASTRWCGLLCAVSDVTVSRTLCVPRTTKKSCLACASLTKMYAGRKIAGRS